MIEERNQVKKGDMENKEILTAEELAKRLKVSKAAVRRWTLDGMPCRRLGGRLVRFEFDESLTWLEQRQQASEQL